MAEILKILGEAMKIIYKINVFRNYKIIYKKDIIIIN